MTDIRVAGISLPLFGDHPKRTDREMFAEVARTAGETADGDASVTESLHCGYLGGKRGEYYDQQETLTTELAASLPRRLGSEDGCASSAAGDWQICDYSRTSRPSEGNELMELV